MSNDELLARIDKIEEDACWYQQRGNDCADMHSVIKALRAVVEFHKSEPRMDETLIRKEIVVCGHCWCNKNTWEQAYRYVYPCPTIQAIAKELG